MPKGYQCDRCKTFYETSDYPEAILERDDGTGYPSTRVKKVMLCDGCTEDLVKTWDAFIEFKVRILGEDAVDVNNPPQ